MKITNGALWENGYCVIESTKHWEKGDVIEIDVPMVVNNSFSSGQN